ncbi:hypothetical protein GCM10023188_26110 [Pontibacter saemangeumensis]|uniref:Uncharacterized protein n=1 Tax=Pontibacter saemangeumensis TaxID=1084525 RepID=A0ABP8LUG4_9BACT
MINLLKLRLSKASNGQYNIGHNVYVLTKNERGKECLMPVTVKGKSKCGEWVHTIEKDAAGNSTFDARQVLTPDQVYSTQNS